MPKHWAVFSTSCQAKGTTGNSGFWLNTANGLLSTLASELRGLKLWAETSQDKCLKWISGSVLAPGCILGKEKVLGKGHF